MQSWALSYHYLKIAFGENGDFGKNGDFGETSEGGENGEFGENECKLETLVKKAFRWIGMLLIHTYTKFAYNRLDLSFTIPMVISRSPWYQPMQKILILAAANYLQICCS